MRYYLYTLFIILLIILLPYINPYNNGIAAKVNNNVIYTKDVESQYQNLLQGYKLCNNSNINIQNNPTIIPYILTIQIKYLITKLVAQKYGIKASYTEINNNIQSDMSAYPNQIVYLCNSFNKYIPTQQIKYIVENNIIYNKLKDKLNNNTDTLINKNSKKIHIMINTKYGYWNNNNQLVAL